MASKAKSVVATAASAYQQRKNGGIGSIVRVYDIGV